MIRGLLADDHSIVRAGLRRLIEDNEDMTVVAETADGREAVRKIRELLPDVAVVDISMPEIDGLEVIRQVIDHPQKIQQFHRKFRQDQQVAAVCLMAFVLAAVATGKMI